MSDLVEQLARQAKAAAESASSMPRQLQSLPRRKEVLHLALPLRVIIFLAINAATVAWALERASSMRTMVAVIAGGLVVSIVVLRIVHVAAQWERGIVLRLGKFQSVRGPGVILIFPVIDHLKISTRASRRLPSRSKT